MQKRFNYKFIVKGLMVLTYTICFFSPTVLYAFSNQDIFNFTRIEYVNPSADGNSAIVATSNIVQNNKHWQRQFNLYYRNNNLHNLNSDTNITQPTLSPDGKYVAYLNNGDKASTLYLVKLGNNQKTTLVSFQGNISAFKWSPDSKYIAFVASPNTATLSTDQLVEAGHENLNAQLYIVPISLDAKPKAVTPNTYSISSGFNDAGFDWFPNQSVIAFASQPKIGWDFASKVKIQILNLKTGHIDSLPYIKDHYANNPAFSLDGKWLAFRTNDETSGLDTNLKNNIFYLNKICAINLTSLKEQCFANTDNENATILGWNAKSTGLYVMDFYKTEGIKLYELNLDSNIGVKLISNTSNFIEPLTISLDATHHILGFGAESTNKAPEAYLSLSSKFKMSPITNFNKNIIADGNEQDISWRSSDGQTIEGLLITPKDYSPLKQYPLIVWLHGGPVGAAWKRFLGGCDEYGSMIEPTSCWGNYLKEGYIVLAPNYRGSTGYGASFRTANYRDFGGGDFQDIESGSDYLIGKSIADAKNIFLTGWSYGGYLTSWAIGQTDKYKAAVEGAGLTDLLSFSGTSDIPNYTSLYLGAMYWDDPFLYVKRSPIINVAAIQTPLLIFGGENDVRVPIEQGIELYTALNRLNKPVKFIVMPKQNHVPVDPQMVLDATIKINSWFNAVRSIENGKR